MRPAPRGRVSSTIPAGSPGPSVVVSGAPAQRPLEGILWMLLTMFLFVTMDSTGKALSQNMDVVQVVWARYFFHVAILAVIFHRATPRLLKSRRPGLQVLRSALLLITTFLFYLGLSRVPIAAGSSIMFVTPLVVTALAVPLLGEQVGWRRWVSILIGFAGAMIIIRPGSGVFGLFAFCILAGACTNALYQITTRKVSLLDAPHTTLLHTGLVGVVVMTALVPFFWQWPTPRELGLFVLMGALGAGSQFSLRRALSAAGASTVAPFSYSSLIWATMWGFVIFGDLPDAATLIGALIIVGSGLYVYHRERLKARS